MYLNDSWIIHSYKDFAASWPTGNEVRISERDNPLVTADEGQLNYYSNFLIILIETISGNAMICDWNWISLCRFWSDIFFWHSRVFELSGINKTNGPDFDFEISMEKSYPS